MKKSIGIFIYLTIMVLIVTACTPPAEGKTNPPITVTPPPGQGPQVHTKTAAPLTVTPQRVQTQKCFRLSWPDTIKVWENQVCQAWNRYANEETGVSNRYGADLVAAMILQASNGSEEAVNATYGAVGLLQIMPSDGKGATYKCGNSPCFAGRPTTKELLNGATNIDFGVEMIVSDLKTKGLEAMLLSWGGEVFSKNVLSSLQNKGGGNGK